MAIPSSSRSTHSLPQVTSSSSTPSSSLQYVPAPTTSAIHESDEVIFLKQDGTPYQGRPFKPSLDSPARTSKGKRRQDDDTFVDLPDVRGRELEDWVFSRRLSKRQAGIDYPACNDQGNDVLSCYPTGSTIVEQGQWTKFIWNARYPEFIGLPRQVDIYLFHADSGEQVNAWLGVQNERSQINILINDSFWDYRTADFAGAPMSYTYYFVVVKAGRELTGGEPRQATWTAIQTRQPDSVISASRASVTSMASLSVASTVSLTSMLSSYSMSSVSAAATADLQGAMRGEDSDDFPSWAIALLVVLGFLALISMAGLSYLLLRNFRRKNNRDENSRRESMGSSSPMMAGQAPSENPHSPSQMTQTSHNYIKGPALSSPVGYASGLTTVADPPSSIRFSNVNDGASTRTGSDKALFSGQDAQIAAAAFREALRQPHFADRPHIEGESPENNGSGEEQDVLSQALAEEGRDIRSVSSVRDVRIQSLEEEDGRNTPTHGH